MANLYYVLIDRKTGVYFGDVEFQNMEPVKLVVVCDARSAMTFCDELAATTALNVLKAAREFHGFDWIPYAWEVR